MTAFPVSLPTLVPTVNPQELCQTVSRQLANASGLTDMQAWWRQQQMLAANVRHNLKVTGDALVLSKLPELKPEQLQQRIQKLDSILDRIDRLIKLMPDETTFKTVVEQLTRSQTTLALLLGLFVGWLTTFSWHQPRKSKAAKTDARLV
jgi:hypothetical protein